MSDWVPSLTVALGQLVELKGTFLSLADAARVVEAAGAASVSLRLSASRRTNLAGDLEELRGALRIPIAVRLAGDEEGVRLASRAKPDWACLVGMDPVKSARRAGRVAAKLKKAGIRLSISIPPNVAAVRAVGHLGAESVEIQAGEYCGGPTTGARVDRELARIRGVAEKAIELGLLPGAGHGISYASVRRLVDIGVFREFHVGRAIIGRALLVGLERAVREMVSAVQAP